MVKQIRKTTKKVKTAKLPKGLFIFNQLLIIQLLQLLI